MVLLPTPKGGASEVKARIDDLDYSYILVTPENLGYPVSKRQLRGASQPARV